MEWEEDKDALKEQKIASQKRLLSLLRVTDENMGWLVDWAEAQASLRRFVIADFWMETKCDDSETRGVKVRGSYTLAGDELIKDFLAHMKAALP
jgi:hypothetical protein